VTRRLVAVDPADTPAAIRAALAGGDAVLPLAPGAPVPTDLPTEVPQRAAVVIETSGSTGRPKRVMLSADALLAGAAASDVVLGGPGQWLLALPVHYVAGVNVLVRAIASGTDPVPTTGRFDQLSFLDAVARLDAARTVEAPRRYASLVPAQLDRLLSHGAAAEALAAFDAVLVGGQATPVSLLERAREAGVRVIRTYGSSETAGGAVYDGVPIGDTAVRVVDGELQLAGSVLAEGYLDDAERTADRFVTDAGVRWYRTGDAGEVTDGVVRVDGRLDDVIISGGVKVPLGAIERVLRERHPDAVVVPAPHPGWGEVPAVVVPVDVPLDELRDLAAPLGAAARPAFVVVVPDAPVLASGKPDRRALAAIVRTRLGLGVEPTA
jgi:o-succinylbenzoate---CoA ligase